MSDAPIHTTAQEILAKVEAGPYRHVEVVEECDSCQVRAYNEERTDIYTLAWFKAAGIVTLVAGPWIGLWWLWMAYAPKDAMSGWHALIGIMGFLFQVGYVIGGPCIADYYGEKARAAVGMKEKRYTKKALREAEERINGFIKRLGEASES